MKPAPALSPASPHRSPLAFPDFRLLFAGLLFGWLVMPMQFVLQIFWLQENVSEDLQIALVGLIGTMRGAGMLGFTLYAGALADRFDRRTVLIATQSVTMVLQVAMVGVMVAGSHPAALTAFFVLILVSSATFAADLPIRQAMVPDVVGASLAPAGIALCTAAIHLAEPPSLVATGFLVDGLGFAGAYALTTAGNALALLTLLPLAYRTRRRPPSAGAYGPKQTLRDIGEALAYARRTPAIRWVLVLLTAVMVFGFPPVANLGPTWITTVIGESIRNFGFIATAWSVAAFAASLALTRWARHSREAALLVGGSMVFAGAFLVFSVPRVPFAVGGNIGLGAALAVLQVASASMIQRLVANEMRARLLTLAGLTLGVAQLLTLPLALVGQSVSLEVLFPVLAVTLVLALIPICWAALKAWQLAARRPAQGVAGP
jgi:hypothetical protein